jgi:hypothetical protein
MIGLVYRFLHVMDHSIKEPDIIQSDIKVWIYILEERITPYKL